MCIKNTKIKNHHAKWARKKSDFENIQRDIVSAHSWLPMCQLASDCNLIIVHFVDFCLDLVCIKFYFVFDQNWYQSWTFLRHERDIASEFAVTLLKISMQLQTSQTLEKADVKLKRKKYIEIRLNTLVII